MSRRAERVGNLIRITVGILLLAKLSDPRIEPAKTSITRVEVAEDLLTAKVFVSVIGTEGEQRRTIRGLCNAAGHIQELMMRQIQLRHTPMLEFVLDEKLKNTLKTLQLIQQATEETLERERTRQAANRSVDSPDDQPKQ